MEKILIIDDEKDIRAAASGILEDEGYEAFGAADETDAARALEEKTPDLVILDVWLQGSNKDGLEILADIKHAHSDLPVVMISGHGTIDTAVSAIKRGAYDFIQKPFASDRLLLVVKRALEAARLKRENKALRNACASNCKIVGNSQPTKELRAIVERIASADSRVLIKGEAGTGKAAIARAIHNASSRADQPFITLGCADLTPDNLMACLSDAGQGSVLLESVSDLPQQTQATLLNAMQDKAARIISTASIDLLDSDFRKDLYYRLAVVPIEVLPLRERKEDIAPLAVEFIDEISGAQNHPLKRLGQSAKAALELYSWPGNVRQLRNAMEWMVILHGNMETEQDFFDAKHLPPEIRGINADADAPCSPMSADLMSLPLRKAREAFEANYLSSQLSRFDGSITKTAEFVGMERSALHRKIRSLGITQHS